MKIKDHHMLHIHSQFHAHTGYIVDGGVSRVPYGGYRILDHLRQFLYMRNVSLINEVESYIIRQASICNL